MAWTREIAVQMVKRVRFEIFFVGTIAWGVGEGRPNREDGTSLGCWVVEMRSPPERGREKNIPGSFLKRFRGRNMNGVFSMMAVNGMYQQIFRDDK